MEVDYQVKHWLQAPTRLERLTFLIGFPVVRTDGRTYFSRRSRRKKERSRALSFLRLLGRLHV